MTKMNKRAIAAGLAGAMALTAVPPVLGAPVLTGTGVLKVAQPSKVIDVRWRGRRGGRWAAAGIAFAASALIGSAIARSRAYSYYYYDGPAYYAPAPVYVAPAPVYVEPEYYVEPGPVYAAPLPDPNGPRRRCWVTTDSDRGFGYWQPC